MSNRGKRRELIVTAALMNLSIFFLVMTLGLLYRPDNRDELFSPPNKELSSVELPSTIEASPEKSFVEESLSKVQITEKQPPQGELRSVQVRAGDSLESLAIAYDVDPKKLMSYNQLPDEHLAVGQLLQLPPEKGVGAFYTVKEGDSPWLIAKRHALPLDEFLKLNELDEQRSRRLRPGQRLRVRE